MNVDVGMAIAVAGLLIGGMGAWWGRKALIPQKHGQTQDRWVSERQRLNRSRAKLSKYAAKLHVAANSQICTIGDSPMLAMAGWPHHPVPLHEFLVTLTDAPESEQADFLEAARHVLPIARHGRRYTRYSEALEDLGRPTLFDNRVSYRLVDLEVSPEGRTHLQFSTCRYFEMLNVAEPLAHEFANSVSGESFETAAASRLWRRLPLRKMFKSDPLRMRDRVILPSIGTLLLRVTDDGSASFLLHRRDTAAVAIAGGHYSLVPAGVLQPSSASPASIHKDLDLWRSIQREAAEELLGVEEALGEGGIPIDYENDEPYASLDRARADGDLSIWSLGWGIDPLTLTLELLTVLTVKAATYDRLFKRVVQENPEGQVVAAGRTPAGLTGFAFTSEVVDGLFATGELSPVAQACLKTALRYKAVLIPA